VTCRARAAVWRVNKHDHSSMRQSSRWVDSIDVGRCMGSVFHHTLPWLARGLAHIALSIAPEYSVVGFYAGLYSYSFTDFFFCISPVSRDQV
jgi:hypothetical protein